MDKKNVFLSHSHLDIEVGRQVAEALRNNGINVWYDEWEIMAGDSLVQKVFNQGLKDCNYFIVLLSGNSVNSPWVKNELDVAVINRISGITKILPVLVEKCEIPVPLRALLWVDLSDGFEEGIKKIVNAIFEVNIKPPLGKVPDHVQALNRQVDGLSKIATAIGLIFLEPGDATTDFQLGADGKDLSDRLRGLTPEQINDGVDELEELGLIKTRNYLGTYPFNFGSIHPTYLLYLYFKNEGLGYDPEIDIKAVAAAAVVKGSVRGSEIAELVKIPTIRINRAVAYLEDNGLADVTNYIGTAPFDFGIVRASRRTRQFSSE